MPSVKGMEEEGHQRQAPQPFRPAWPPPTPAHPHNCIPLAPCHTPTLSAMPSMTEKARRMSAKKGGILNG